MCEHICACNDSCLWKWFIITISKDIYYSININLLNDNFHLILLIYISRMKSDYIWQVFVQREILSVHISQFI